MKWIYEIHIFVLRKKHFKQMKIIAVCTQLKQLRQKRAWKKKIQASTGVPKSLHISSFPCFFSHIVASFYWFFFLRISIPRQIINGRFDTRGNIIRPYRWCEWTHSASSSIKTGTRRIICLDEEYFVLRCSRRISSRWRMRLVPVFILEDPLCVYSYYLSGPLMRPLV